MLCSDMSFAIYTNVIFHANSCVLGKKKHHYCRVSKQYNNKKDTNKT